MHPLFQFGRQDVVNHPVLLDPGFALKCRRDNFDAKMAFPVRPGSRMALMLRRFINHLQENGCNAACSLLSRVFPTRPKIILRPVRFRVATFASYPHNHAP